MSAGHGDVRHLDIPDRGELYEDGERVVIVQAPDGARDLERGVLGTHFVMSCRRVERDGVRMLNVGLLRVA